MLQQSFLVSDITAFCAVRWRMLPKGERCYTGVPLHLAMEKALVKMGPSPTLLGNRLQHRVTDTRPVSETKGS